ncbi:NADH-cytochrome b5 reductase [Borealophlyctis nickersoniae]|nr:NADH-cytochrome b5 reductase [Borealophlyctis nickersoniae]
MSLVTDCIVGAIAVSLAAAHYATESTYLPAATVILVGAYLYLRPASKQVAKRKSALSKDEWREFPLKEKVIITHNTAIYRFSLPNPDDVLGLPIGQHISVAVEIEGKDVQRSYTPTSSDDDLGHFDLLIKASCVVEILIFAGGLQIGQNIRVKGPKGQFRYTPNCVRAFGMIAGGTGITPMLQIIKAVLKNPLDITEIDLIFANVKEEDILLRDELDDLAKKHPQFRVHYVLNEPPAGWTGGVGFVTKEFIQKHCPPPADDIKILLCGPLPMIKAMSTYTEELGYPKSKAISKMNDVVFKF